MHNFAWSNSKGQDHIQHNTVDCVLKQKGKANRGVAQLAARHVRDVEVGSSSLLTPT